MKKLIRNSALMNVSNFRNVIERQQSKEFRCGYLNIQKNTRRLKRILFTFCLVAPHRSEIRWCVLFAFCQHLLFFFFSWWLHPDIIFLFSSKSKKIEVCWRLPFDLIFFFLLLYCPKPRYVFGKNIYISEYFWLLY